MTGLLLTGSVFLWASGDQEPPYSGGTGNPSNPPPIDLFVPPAVETATFALG